MDVVTDFLRRLQPKDWITLIASLSAFAFSLLSYWQKSAEGKIGLRKQLTDLIEKLTDISTEAAKYFGLPMSKREADYPPNYVRLKNDQRRFMVRQAEFLSRRIRRLVSPYEHLVIAGAFDSIDDTVRAEEFYQRASRAKDLLDRGIAIRGYARYLFNRGRPSEGRQKYKEAVRVFAGESDYLRMYRADTYERWASQEREWGDPTASLQLLRHAIEEYSRLDNPSRRDHEVGRVEAQLPSSHAGSNAAVSGTTPTPGAPDDTISQSSVAPPSRVDVPRVN